MKELFMENKTLWIMLAGLIAVTVFMMIKASKAVKRTNAQKEELMKRLDRMKMLSENYTDLTVEKIENDKSENLVAGIAYIIQKNIEQSDDLNEAFDELNEDQKMIYALSWFADDAKNSVRDFFRQYSRPLTPYVVKATDMFAPAESKKDIKRMFDIYDDENEGVSFFEDEVSEIDARLKETFDFDKTLNNAIEYVKRNAEKFV